MSPATTARRGSLGPVERVVRVVAGGLVAIVALSFWLSATGIAALAWFGATLLGLDFVVTGLRGYCPLYSRLGIGRAKVKGA